MLIGYVSDERYVALPDVLLEFISSEGASTETRSRASGSIHADLTPGPYQVVLHCEGYGLKRVSMTVAENRPYQFRLLKDDLLGYMWPKWVQSGERSEFRVHCDEAYKLELFRYGMGKEFIKPIGWYDEHGPGATVQITPDGDYTQTGVQWNRFGYTNPHHKQYLTAPDRSGLYYCHASTATGRFFSFPWIVAPKTPQHSIAVLASNVNWNCYNNFGGRSNYIHPDRFPPTPTVNARLELNRYTNGEHINYGTEDYAPLSFDRPEPISHIPLDVGPKDPIEGRAASHVAEAEWRLLAWMEQEGFNYDLWAETHLHFGQLNLDDYKVLVISTHPEYWSEEMYFGVKKWVFERGGKLMYLGGNGLNAKVEFLDESTMKVWNGDARVMQEKGLESRFHIYVESEANLLGVVFTDTGIMTAAPYRVIDADHWIFEGTGKANGDLFGEASLHMRIPGGASGHETDKVSPSSPPNVHTVAKGENPDEGGGEIVHFDTDSGGGVFSVGSITWPSSIMVDETVSRMTANVLRRFTS
ncbi:MAG: carboxypeptidase regulatory-like domain-containing protein [Gemmatimonadetes bacterium]|jgi:N,N-dimethylformamidase|nr:carboxypeptidase regulatory-like domain-containing protein [Gemmatimonadota bacterium]MBT5058034.1 carboxypeptidase regulatory-like domain-containing protein [Gemmatimonadota bacterium]MBT5141694.1 carboxypeptidase regulatory-like domain-containing protein [Gemmatimonadota bacterium]MBT5590997.1 carboxypeptidase regulatory-like domain-containing protein [Gemmatimonadota bacterium]MBT5964937.1 carboxypeptidase regulatory-like domain-containing protein [Gemmatimonadota bacterium]